ARLSKNLVRQGIAAYRRVVPGGAVISRVRYIQVVVAVDCYAYRTAQTASVYCLTRATRRAITDRGVEPALTKHFVCNMIGGQRSQEKQYAQIPPVVHVEIAGGIRGHSIWTAKRRGTLANAEVIASGPIRDE